MIIQSTTITPEIQKWIDDGFAEYNAANGYTRTQEAFCYEMQRDGQRIGVANGEFSGGWCYLSGLMVAPEWRRKGVGGQLLQYVELEAQKRKAIGVYMNTFTLEAPAFYEKHGYEKFGELNPFANAMRIYYKKMFK
jgi:GNAT superfamily N-acetyltransferase